MNDTVASVGPLRIGLLHQYRLDTSGSGIDLRQLAEYLRTRGHAVSLMSHDPEPAFSSAPLPSPSRSDAHAAIRSHPLRGAGTPVAYPRADEPGNVLFRDLPDSDLTG